MIKRLLDQYGFGEERSDSSNDSRIYELIIKALEASLGVIFIHDLFCLVNRRLQLERTISPPEFVDILEGYCNQKLSAISLLSVNKYTLVVLKSKYDIGKLRDAVLEYLDDLSFNSPKFISSVEFANECGINDPNLASILLAQIESEFACIVRDSGGEFDDLVFYKNLYFN
jgi:hypothetical protein